MIRYSIAFGLEILARYPWIWQIGVLGFGLVAITALIAIIKAGKSKPKPVKKDKQTQSKKSKWNKKLGKKCINKYYAVNIKERAFIYSYT